ncbi:flavin reductase family protein, partial [Rhizobium ruizarguesonis]
VDPDPLRFEDKEIVSIDETLKERRAMHHSGDGSFTVDGGTLDLRKRMVKWRHLQ